MRAPRYMKITTVRSGTGQGLFVTVKLKRWGVIPLAWKAIRREYAVPWYKWPNVIWVYILVCLKVMLLGWRGKGEGEGGKS